MILMIGNYKKYMINLNFYKLNLQAHQQYHGNLKDIFYDLQFDIQIWYDLYNYINNF